MATDPLAEIHKYIDMMTATRDQLQDAGETVNNLSHEYEEAEHDVEDKVTKGFLDDVETFTHTLEDESKQTNTQVDEFAQAVASVQLTKVLDSIHYFDEQEDVSTQQLTEFLDHVEKAFDNAVQNGLDKVGEGTHDVDELMGHLEEEVDQTFEAFSNEMQEIGHELEELEKETLDTFHNAMGHVSEELTNNVKSFFESIAEGLNDTATNELDNGFEQLTSSFGDMFSEFSGNIEETSEHLMEAGAQIFSEMVSHCTEEIKDALVQAIEKAVGDVIQQLVEEIVEQITMMTAGAAITAAIAEFVPLLVAAKNVCGVINDLLEVMNLGA
jgi:hypothetical protein